MNNDQQQSVFEYISKVWDTEVIPKLEEYIRIPNLSPSFDEQWESNGLLYNAMSLLHEWVMKQNIQGMQAKIHTEKGFTPFLHVFIPANHPTDHSVLMYGHMDKQPPLFPWAEGLDPYIPVIRDGKLYGRGGADDGYFQIFFTAISSIQALQVAGLKHSNISIIIEACEESGSIHLPKWIEDIKPQLGSPDLILCLDSGSLNYEQLWVTTALRGIVNFHLRVGLLEEALHSGIAGGIVPCTFRILRQLLSRIEDEKTGELIVPELFANIPNEVMEQMKEIDKLGPGALTKDIRFRKGAQGYSGSSGELALANSWKPCLTLTGIGGIPTMENAGNVLRTETNAVLSIRLPPTVNPQIAFNAVKEILERDPPYGAHVEVVRTVSGLGWKAPEMQPWLVNAANSASLSFFSKPLGNTGLGGSIPFMTLLGNMFPDAQFIITGILGPQSNAHGPNEFLHIDYTKKITCCIAYIVQAHFQSKCT